ncbi:MAG TPA: NAD(+) synthase [Candidatus Megaira endosymbiont of Hartmannula sinica]|nr:NAD(+) synthase [Candidatus Megaera endosymbiont of Hartmannula sinica]
MGLSGGIDSAITLYYANQISDCKAIILPTSINSLESLNDAKQLCENLLVTAEIISIEKYFDKFSHDLLDQKNIENQDISFQNLQSRIRGMILMTIANKESRILLTTGNKSEYLTGYSTIYGDMNGGFNPIKDLYKSEVFELARYINIKHQKETIPINIINKEPSAELCINQKDSDSLPEYKILDQILYEYIELGYSVELLRNKYTSEIIDKITRLISKSEFKRRQSAPGVILSTRSLDKMEWYYNI